MNNMSFSGMFHSGIGPIQLNNLLSSLNLPHISESLLRRRCDEIGPVLENLADAALEEEGAFVQNRCVFLFMFLYNSIVSRYCLTNIWLKGFMSDTYFYWEWGWGDWYLKILPWVLNAIYHMLTCTSGEYYLVDNFFIYFFIFANVFGNRKHNLLNKNHTKPQTMVDPI